MKIGLIVLCRYNSSRLPGKILKEIADKPLLSYIIERLKCSREADDIIVATSNKESDDPIEAYCLNQQIKCFRGSLEDVSGRFLACAKSHDLDYAIRINGDNLFTDHEVIDAMIKKSRSQQYDFVSNVKDRTFPTGMSIEILNTKFYESQIQKFDSNEFREHVTYYFYEHPEAVKRVFHYYNTIVAEAKGMKLAVDSEEDFNFATKVISAMHKPHTEYDLKELIELIKSLK